MKVLLTFLKNNIRNRNHKKTENIMEFPEIIRKLKRNIDGYFNYRRTFILILIVFGLIVYLGPELLRYLTVKRNIVKDLTEKCLSDRLLAFTLEAEEMNLNIRHIPKKSNEKDYLAYIGNGGFGLSLEKNEVGSLFIRKGRTLSLPVDSSPVVALTLMSDMKPQEAIVVRFRTGTVHHFQCYSSDLCISSMFLAHRKMPSLFIQEIKIINPSNENYNIKLSQKYFENLSSSSDSRHIYFDNQQYIIKSGALHYNKSNQVIPFTMITKKLVPILEVKSRSTTTLELLSTIHYSDLINKDNYITKIGEIEKEAIQKMKQALKSTSKLVEEHINSWENIWRTGLTISYSKAIDAINGDKINATIYYVLSQVLLQDVEEQEIESEGCYAGYHTLQAKNLWINANSIEMVNRLTSYWLLTLEKQGCHNLVKYGASEVMQAMVLSLGGFRFSKHHLEFNIHPKDLHRDYFFRRLSYGSNAHLNISVVVGEDNKAILLVALDRSDKYYYACDGGCLDDPVLLGPENKMFPVKLTDPLTPILYITCDKQHMEDLRHAIHFKEIKEAPAHEHNLIALHKHGHQLGGLPTLFWISICFLIIIFHLFLFKLIYNEYCGNNDKYRIRYGKL